MNIQEFLKTIKIGDKYKRNTNDGKALGCSEPIFLAFPHIWDTLNEELKDGELTIGNDKIMFYLNKYADEVSLSELQPFDIVIIRLPLYNLLHFSLYIGDGNILQCNLKNGLFITKLSLLIRDRIVGGFRVNDKKYFK